jgi:hypothetical protein
MKSFEGSSNWKNDNQMLQRSTKQVISQEKESRTVVLEPLHEVKPCLEKIGELG